MNLRHESKVDLHVHSKFSDRPSEWFLRRIGAPECYVEPMDIYHRARQRGMDFVTISDHNCIRGAMEIAHLPGTFISNEVTTYFPENGCKVHALVCGIGEEQFREIQHLRENIYELHAYMAEQDIICSVAHPLYRVNNRLTIDQIERLLLMFKRFELINGARDRRAAELVEAVFSSLSPTMIEEMADRQGMEPSGHEPWRKYFTAGSDDHSGVYTASAHTVSPWAGSVDEFLAHLRRGDHRPGGSAGCSVMMGHSFYHIGYSYYKAKFLNGEDGGRRTIVGQLFNKLLEKAEPLPQPATLGQRMRDLAVGFVWARKKNRMSEVDRVLVDEFSALFSQEPKRDTACPPMDDRHTFQIAGRISHTLGYSFLRRFEKYVREGRLMESLQTVASLGPVALSMAPYLAAFSTQHKDEEFHRRVAEHFPAAAHLRHKSQRKAWVTDTFSDVNGVARTIQTLAGEAQRHGRPITVLTCLEQAPRTRLDLKNFAPVGTFGLPEYESQTISFPPFLDIIEYIERHRFNELIISTPGPMGLTALAAARLLGIRVTGIYHTDFPFYVRAMTEDEDLEELTWKYMQWFYEQAHRVLVPSDYYRRHLIDHHFEPDRLGLLVRGVDTGQFHPGFRQERFYEQFGLDPAQPTFVYVGRVSMEKNLHLLVGAMRELAERGREFNLAVVGDGPYLAKMKSQCRGLPVAFTGFLDGEQLATAYASADVMLFPSESDTFGNAVLEAQASGLPAIVSERGGPPDIVRPHDSGLIVDVGQPGALADAMQRLGEDAGLRREMSQRALVNASERTWAKVLAQFLEDEPAAEAAPMIERQRVPLLT